MGGNVFECEEEEIIIKVMTFKDLDKNIPNLEDTAKYKDPTMQIKRRFN